MMVGSTVMSLQPRTARLTRPALLRVSQVFLAWPSQVPVLPVWLGLGADEVEVEVCLEWVDEDEVWCLEWLDEDEECDEVCFEWLDDSDCEGFEWLELAEVCLDWWLELEWEGSGVSTELLWWWWWCDLCVDEAAGVWVLERWVEKPVLLDDERVHSLLECFDDEAVG